MQGLGWKHTLSQTPLPQNNEAGLCFGIFPVWIPWQVNTGLEERDSGFVCVLHYGGCAGVRRRGPWSSAHRTERNPTWAEREQKSPRKHWTSKTKHFLCKWIYLLAWLPKEPQQNDFLMGNRATAWGLPKDLHEKHPISAKTLRFLRGGAQLTPTTIKQLWFSRIFNAIIIKSAGSTMKLFRF